MIVLLGNEKEVVNAKACSECGNDIYDDSDYCGCDVVAEPDLDDDDSCTDWASVGCGCDYDDFEPTPDDCGCDD